jgi:hypothetical protein
MRRLDAFGRVRDESAWPLVAGLLVALAFALAALMLGEALAGCVGHPRPRLGGDGVGATLEIDDAPARHDGGKIEDP